MRRGRDWDIRPPDDDSGLREVAGRYQKREQDTGTRKISLFPRNPSFRIMLIDLLIILVFAVIVLPVSRKIMASGKYENAQFKLSAREYEQVLLVSLQLKDLHEDLNWDEPFSVTYSHKDCVLGTVIFAFPEKGASNPVYYRQRFPFSGEDAVQALLRFRGGSELELTCVVKRESQE